MRTRSRHGTSSCAALPVPLSAQSIDPELTFNRLLGERDNTGFHLHTTWESRHVSEGHDNLDSGALLAGTIEADPIAANPGVENVPTDSLSFGPHLAYNFGINRQLLRPGDATLKDFFQSGVELSRSF